jgi:HAMP domain-containing protein
VGGEEVSGEGASEKDKPVVDLVDINMCLDLLRDPSQKLRVSERDGNLCVATLLTDPAGGPDRALFMEHRTEEILDLLRSRVFFISVTGLALVVVSILLSIWLGRRLSRPLRVLAHAAGQFGQGDLQHRIEIKADREFEELACSLNGMADSLQRHVRQLKKETQLRERLESEMRIAAELQQSLLPESPPMIPEVEVAGWSIPAREVGGDFYDYFDWDGKRLGIAIGDATDKGLPAAMLTSECSSVLRAVAVDTDSPAEMLCRTNNIMCQRVGESGRFVTMFVMVIDLSRDITRLCCSADSPRTSNG